VGANNVRANKLRPAASPATGLKLSPLEFKTMRNITVTVSDETYLLARVWAAERDTSLSAVVQYLLQSLKGMPHAQSS
jgi:hypothetical protein